jgi:hypothetical protein
MKQGGRGRKSERGAQSGKTDNRFPLKTTAGTLRSLYNEG